MKVLFSITSKVKPGSQRGRTLGFPTVNLDVPTDELIDGIYIAKVYKNKAPWPALLFIGSALTFNETQKKVEAYVLAEIGDWYGEEITVEALVKLRDNKRFGTAEELVTQMKQDELAARKYFEMEVNSE